MARNMAVRQSLARTQDLDDSEDIAQEVLIRVYLHLPGFRFQSKFSSWVFRITENETRAFFRKRTSALSAEERSFFLGTALEPDQATDSRADMEEAWAALEEIMAKLPAFQRKVFQLAAFDQLRPCETARVLGKSQTNVRASLHRARTKIRKQLLAVAPAVAEDLFGLGLLE